MKKKIDFVKHIKLYVMISVAIMVVGILCNVIFGTRMNIAFKGGTQIRYSYTTVPDLDKVTADAKETLGNEASATLDEVNSTQIVSVSLPGEVTTEQQKAFADKLEADFPDNGLQSFSSNTLTASMGVKFFAKCMLAIGLAAIFLLIYVGLRFRKIGGLSAAAFALLALVHDLLIVYFTFVIFRIELNDNFVAVMLTILGYSLNDTIIYYDRIRENQRKVSLPLRDVVNLSINQSMRRTLMTSVTTLLSIAVVAIVAIVMHVDSIISFALPMLLGTASGFYSSICLSAPLWVLWNERKAKKAAAKAKQLKKA